MAIDNLNFYNTGLPAGQQTDRYSSQPGCLRSKNLDIFSSSKSVKATAWSTPQAGEGGIIAQTGNLILKTDGKVYERENGVDTLFIDPAENFPVYQVCYSGGRYGTYENAQRGTPTDMTVAMEGDEWKSFVVFTDRASFVYSKVKYLADKKIGSISSNLTQTETEPIDYGYPFQKNTTSGANSTIEVKLTGGQFTTVPIRIYAQQSSSSETNITLQAVRVRTMQYYYDPELDAMNPNLISIENMDLPEGDIKNEGGLWIDVPNRPGNNEYWITLQFSYTRKEGITSGYSWSGTLYVGMNDTESPNFLHTKGDYNYYYTYLQPKDRKLERVGEYYWMKGTSFQVLYQWVSSWVSYSGEKDTRYDFVQYMGWANDPGMDIVGMIVRNEQVYMIGNMEGNGYIIPCDLTGGRGTPYIAYGCEFKGVANIDYLMYLVGEDRGISQLWVYNGQEMVSIIGGSEEKDKKNLIDNAEQYKFDGKMVEYRDDLILSTSDNRIFAYGQTFGGKGGTFIHQLPGTIKELKADGKDLSVKYTLNSADYVTVLQDDTPIKNYNTEWMAEYPIVIGNHLLEKEESDLYASYILPSANCSLEFWGMANHYHFWTFTSSDSYTFSTTASYKMKGCTGNYVLKYIEKNGNQYTFRLEGDLPIQNGNDMKITDTEGTELITYSDFNHFRKIGGITTTEYQEGEFRFHNLNNKLELPKSHSLQIMVKGKGTVNYTPELFALDLVANQRDRG